MQIPETTPDRFEDGMIKALCYLHQEAVKGNHPDVAEILSLSIDVMREKITSQDLTQEGESWLKQFYLLRGFQALSPDQKLDFLQEIEAAEKYFLN